MDLRRQGLKQYSKSAVEGYTGSMCGFRGHHPAEGKFDWAFDKVRERGTLTTL
jgi:hypothetical protein